MPANDLKNLTTEQLLLLAAETLRWCHEELKNVDLEGRHMLTIVHPYREQILAIAARMEELVDNNLL